MGLPVTARKVRRWAACLLFAIALRPPKDRAVFFIYTPVGKILSNFGRDIHPIDIAAVK